MADAAEIRVIPTGPTPETAALTLAVTFTASPAHVLALKTLVPYWRGIGETNRWWDEQNRIWFVHADYLEVLKAWARDFDQAMLINGNRWENLKTKQVYEQQTLFE
jgi:hypothetical protein